MAIRFGDHVLDLEVDRQGQLDNEIPEQPVETREAIADNIKRNSDIYSATVRISPDLRRIAENLEDVAEGDEQSVQEAIIGLGRDEKERDMNDKLNQLIDLRDNREVRRLVTPERVVPAATILSMTYTRSAQLQYLVDITFREVITADADAADEDNAGRRSSETADEEAVETADEESWLDIFKVDFGGLIGDLTP